MIAIADNQRILNSVHTEEDLEVLIISSSDFFKSE